MADQAKVLSVQALKDFRVALINFVEEARNALGGVDMELRRTRDWLERDQLSYWQMQVKRRHEAMMMARTELFRRKISQQGSDAVSDTEQKEALREAERKLRVAEEKVAIVKKLIPMFHHAQAEYTSHATPLADHLAGGVEKSIATLEKMVQSLEEYLALAPPSSPRPQMGGESTTAEMSSARAGGSTPAAAVKADQAEAVADAASREGQESDSNATGRAATEHHEPHSKEAAVAATSEDQHP
jgi:hypothetical protein